MWRSSWVAITVRRMRAVPTGTDGGRMAGAQTRAERSDAPTARAAAASPMSTPTTAESVGRTV